MNENFFLKRTACLVEKLDCENGLDSNVKQFCESVAQKVNQKNKWSLSSAENSESIKIPQDDLDALLADLAELLNDDTFDVHESLGCQKKDISKPNLPSKDIGRSGAAKRKPRRHQAWMERDDEERQNFLSEKHQWSPLKVTTDPSEWFQPKEGYTSLKNAYPNLFEGEEDKEDKLPRRKGRKSRTGRPRKCNQIPRKQAPLADPLLEPTASDNGKASGNQSVLHLNASKLNFPSREKSVQAAIHTLQNTGYGLTGVDEQFISPDETLTVDIEQKRVLYALVSFKIHPKRKIQVVRPPNDDSDGYFYQPILPKNLEHIWLELLGVQLIPSTKVHAVPREKNVRSVAIGTDKTNVIGPNSKLNSITKKFVPVLRKSQSIHQIERKFEAN
ncbi:uncharacterized protein LOC134844789 [Symsagittifera roscoffensis]|uniref:uncharacterized protein LOC134844789 n=1 Tax=Symsagittifera roscoffensis TaxID=84072 RepID=UPI00307B17BB